MEAGAKIFNTAQEIKHLQSFWTNSAKLKITFLKRLVATELQNMLLQLQCASKS